MKRLRAHVPTRRNHHLKPGQACFDEHSGLYGTVRKSHLPDSYDVEWWSTGEVARNVDGRALRAAWTGPALAQLAREFSAEVRADYNRGAITVGELNDALRVAHAAVRDDEDAVLVSAMRGYAAAKRGGR